jgi:hypothetical protein
MTHGSPRAWGKQPLLSVLEQPEGGAAQERDRLHGDDGLLKT